MKRTEASQSYLLVPTNLMILDRWICRQPTAALLLVGGVRRASVKFHLERILANSLPLFSRVTKGLAEILYFTQPRILAIRLFQYDPTKYDPELKI